MSKEEWNSLQALRSQNAILKVGRGRHRKYLPYVFTEHGALMAANILNSPRAVAMSVYANCLFFVRYYSWGQWNLLQGKYSPLQG